MARVLSPLSPAAALARLRRRPDVVAVEETARAAGVSVRVVGGAVRDAFLRRPGHDVDVALPGAASFAAALAGRLGTRAVAVGTSPRQVWKVPSGADEIDVWETGGDASADLLRRDVTVNALAFDLPHGLFSAPATALDDLARGRLRPPRPGVYLEDPVRVLRVARFEATLDGFAPVPSALAELREAAGRLDDTAVERRLAELDTILTLGPDRARRALDRLERLGALARLLPGTPSQRARGVALATRGASRDAGLLRALLVAPLGERGSTVLEGWRAPRRDQRLARALLHLPRAASAGRRDVAAWLRAARPFAQEAIVWAGATGARALARAARRLVDGIGLAAILEPIRPIEVDDVASLLGLSPSPELGAALAALDLALAAGEVTDARTARAFLLEWRSRDRR